MTGAIVIIVLLLLATRMSERPVEPTPAVRQAIRRQAEAFARDEVRGWPKAKRVDVTIPEAVIGRYEQALLAVYQHPHQRGRSAAAVRSLRSARGASRSLEIAHTPALTTGRWPAGDLHALDSALAPIGMRVRSPEVNWRGGLYLDADRAIDPEGVAKRLTPLPFFGGVLWDLSGLDVGGPQGVRAKRVGGGMLLTYAVGWGDCPSGCISRHTWKYLVIPGGAVLLLASTGTPLPNGLLPSF